MWRGREPARCGRPGLPPSGGGGGGRDGARDGEAPHLAGGGEARRSAAAERGREQEGTAKMLDAKTPALTPRVQAAAFALSNQIVGSYKKQNLQYFLSVSEGF